MSFRATIAAFVALLALTGLTFGLSGVALGAFEVPVALGIGACKAAIVGAVFMELVRGPVSHRVSLIVAVALLVALITFAAGDVLTRP